jgi:V/A-type H+-transporting ATPase subunit C
MKSIPDSRYIFITGVIRALEVKRVRKDMIDQILRSGSLKAGMEILHESLYFEYIRMHGADEDLDGMLSWRRGEVFDFLSKYSTDDNVAALLRSAYDFHNIKVLLKNKIFDYDDISNLSIFGSFSREKITGIMRDEEYNSLHPDMKSGIYSAVELYFTLKNPLVIDAVLDKFMFRYQLNLSENFHRSWISDFYRLAVDLLNFRIVFRSKDFINIKSELKNILINGGNIPEEEFLGIIADSDTRGRGVKIADKYGLSRLANGIDKIEEDLFQIEKECDNTLLDYIRTSDYFIWGPEPLVAYAFIVEMEIKVLGIVLSSFRSGFSEEWIRKRLPEFD